ncbi:hypothetical protein HY419_01910, partial [candidate division WWE3 bacterium]|nr:hypothetical protein [candidate division WWE3 bacterium]
LPMFSRILIKLIDEAVLPAVLLVAARIIGVIAVAKYYDIPIENGKGVLPFYFSDPRDFVVVNSYATLFMFAVIFAGGVFFLLKSRVLHDSHISPHTAAKVFSLNLGSFVKTSFDLYSEGAIWLSYSYLLTLVMGLQVYFGIVYSWLFLLSLCLSVLLTLVFVSDVEREIVGSG